MITKTLRSHSHRECFNVLKHKTQRRRNEIKTQGNGDSVSVCVCVCVLISFLFDIFENAVFMFLLQKDSMVKDVRLVYVYTGKQWSGIQKHILWECPLKV